MKKLIVEQFEPQLTMLSATEEGCDPFTKSIEGPFEAGILAIGEFTEEAKEHWNKQAKYPIYKPPKPEVKPAPPKAVAEKPKIDINKPAKSEEDIKAKIEAMRVQNATQGTLLEVPKQEPTAEQKAPEPTKAEKQVERHKAEAGKGIFLATGEGPFEDIQAALDALGIPKKQRPNHNRYNRLSQKLQAQIEIRG